LPDLHFIESLRDRQGGPGMLTQMTEEAWAIGPAVF
jgi:hypothetical protein